MFRTTATRSVARSLQTFQSASTKSPFTNHILRASLKTSARPYKASNTLAIALQQPFQQKALVRYASGGSGLTTSTIDTKAEAEFHNVKLEAEPELVSTGSSVKHVRSEVGVENPEQDVDMMAGMRGDFNTIKETFTLRDVPREALFVGLAGVIPYLATSLTTVYLSFDIQYAAHHGQGFLLSGEMAEQALHIIEPIQLGYGATIISFLGAIHWGLEWAGFGGYQGYPRYSIGIVATAVAWPTLLFSAEVGLIAQFLAFTFLYYTDARAATRGWAPSWYATYRFVLTFVVGASIVASLIGRGQIADLITRPPGPADRMQALRQTRLDELEYSHAEEKARSKSGGDDEEAEEEEE